MYNSPHPLSLVGNTSIVAPQPTTNDDATPSAVIVVVVDRMQAASRPPAARQTPVRGEFWLARRYEAPADGAVRGFFPN